MYRSSVVSFQSKLARLSRPIAATQPHSKLDSSDARTSVLDDLRARMNVVLARSVERGSKKGPSVDREIAPDLPFVTTETPLGPLHVRHRRFGVSHRMGRFAVHPAISSNSEILALLAIDPSIASCDPSRALYLDTETTGLAGGAGTVAFLVGLAFWDKSEHGDDELVLEQLLVRNLGEEGPMLARLAERIRDASMLVTFNGKSFDLPLVRTRFAMAQMERPTEPPHFDLVHVARRLHKPRGIECKLTTLERVILGFERHDDVASGDVSACYLHFLRSGDTTSLLGVIEHNAWDVIAMVALLGLYGEPLEATSLAAEDLVGVARTMRRAGAIERALEVADHAVNAGADEALRARAEIAKARGDRARALADFEALAEKIDDPRVRLELAKLYEHYVRAPDTALAITLRGTGEDEARTSKRHARLTRKSERARLPLLEPIAKTKRRA